MSRRGWICWWGYCEDGGGSLGVLFCITGDVKTHVTAVYMSNPFINTFCCVMLIKKNYVFEDACESCLNDLWMQAEAFMLAHAAA